MEKAGIILKRLKDMGRDLGSGAPFSSSNQFLLTEMICPPPPAQTQPLFFYLSLPFESAEIQEGRRTDVQ